MKKPIYVLTMLITALLCLSCSKEEANEPVNLLSTEAHIITYVCNDNSLDVVIDAVGDTTNAINGEWPNEDLFRIYIDVNNNTIVDDGTDFVVSPLDGQMCYATLSSQTAISGCSFFDDLTGDTQFTTSDNSNKNHLVFQVGIPKRLLSSENKANLVIEIYDSETGWVRYPKTSPFFDSTLEITW